MYIQDCYKNNFEEDKIPSNTKKLAFVTSIIKPAIMLFCIAVGRCRKAEWKGQPIK